jgi:hypothetical protein
MRTISASAFYWKSPVLTDSELGCIRLHDTLLRLAMS